MMLLSQAAQVLNGRVVGEDVRFTAVSTDSRSIRAGELFIALRGPSFDGYDFVGAAAQMGAVAALVNADSYHSEEPGCTLLLVEDTRLALGQLAAYWRTQFDIPLVAITGSNGKTTVKEMLASILRMSSGSTKAVLATQGNLNNDIGMPLTLLKLNAVHRYAVIEMGMNHPGEIDYLTCIAAPDVALINNASGAHLEGLGTVEAVARAKSEIFAGLHAHGTAVINADDDFAPLWRTAAGAHQLLEFGLSVDADISGTWHATHDGAQIDVTVPQGMFAADLHVPGEHNVRNALAAVSAAVALNIPLERIAAGLEAFIGVSGRLQRKTGKQGATLIDDTYNANPASMRAAIDVLARESGKRVLVIGDMGELGDNAASLHAQIGEVARKVGIEGLYALGTLSAHAVKAFGDGGHHFDDLDKLIEALELVVAKDTAVLIKGSRFMKMDRVARYFETGTKEAADEK